MLIQGKVDNSQVATSTEYYVAGCRGLPSDKESQEAVSTSTLINSINPSKLKKKRST